MVFSANGILDAYTLELLGSKNKLRYGRYRMFACLSWGIGAIVMGYVTDHYGFGPNFYIYGTLGAISTLLVAWRIPNVKQQQEQQDESGSVVQLLLLATRPRVTFFLLEVIIVGIGMGTVERLLFLYMVDDLQASTLLCGASVGVNVLLELPIFWNAVRFGDCRVLYIAIMLCLSSILTPLYV
jgi:predicted MFS family arabinose efflux permease